jgi:hypothetical protein
MTPEGLVKVEVLDYLKAAGIFHMRMQSGRAKVRGGWMHVCPAGTADILAFDENGGVVWIELKRLKGEQREKQVEFQAKVTAIGHKYVVVRSVEDVAAAFKEAA